MMGCGKGTAGLGYGRGPTVPQVCDSSLSFVLRMFLLLLTLPRLPKWQN
jgi:hypothetical protein